MPFYENRSVLIYYEEAGSGFCAAAHPRRQGSDSIGDAPHRHLPPGASTVTAVGSSPSAMSHAIPSDSSP